MGMPTRPSKRGPGRPPLSAEDDREQRERILAAATRVFAKHGYRETDVQEVADLAGVGKASVYRRFASKVDLFRAACVQGVDAMQRSVQAAMAAADTPLQRVRAGVTAYLVYWDANPDVVELLVQERAEFRGTQLQRCLADREQAREEARQLFGSLIAAGIMRPAATDRYADVIFNLLHGTMHFNRLLGRKKSIDEQVEDILAVFFLGALADSARKEAF